MALASLSCSACTQSSFSIALSPLVQYFLLSSYPGRGNPRLLTAAFHDHHPSLMFWPKLSSAEEHCCGSAAPFTDPHIMNKLTKKAECGLLRSSFHGIHSQARSIFFVLMSTVSSSLSWLFQRKQNIGKSEDVCLFFCQMVILFQNTSLCVPFL